MNPPSESTTRARWLVLALVSLVAAVSCDGGCACDPAATSLPNTPEARLEAFGGHLPAEVDAAFFFVDLPGVRSGLSVLADRFSGSLPVDAYRREIISVVGLNLLDETSYRAAGIHPDGGFAFATFEGAPVVAVYLSDPRLFEAQVVGALRKHYRVSEEPARDPQTGVTTVVGKGVEFSYTILGANLAIVAGKPVEGKASSAETLAKVLGADKKLDDTEEFAAFASKVGNQWPASAYLSTKKVLEIYKSLDPSLKKYQREVIDAFGENIEWAGVGWTADGKAARGGAFFAVKKETLAAVAGLDAPRKDAPDFAKIVQDRAYLFVRTSLDAQIFWREYQKLMPEKQLRFVKRIFKNVKASTSIDIEADLVNNMTGNVGLVVYDVDVSKFEERRATDRMRAVSFLAHIQVQAPDRFVAMADRLVTEFRGAIRRRDLPGGLVRYGFSENSTTAPPFAIYLIGDMVTVASTTVPEAKIIAALIGSERPLRRDATSAGAKSLLSDLRATGVHVNLSRLRERVKSLGGGLIGDIFGPTSSAVIQLELVPGGIMAKGEVAFVASPSQGKPVNGTSKGAPQ